MGRRVGRRRALAVSGSAALGAAFLAACGGDDDDTPAGPTSAPASSGGTGAGSSAGGGSSGAGTGGTAANGLLTAPQDTSAQAKRGGVHKSALSNDVPNFDPSFPAVQSLRFLQMCYSKLTQIKPGTLQPSNGEIVGDLAESWEFSPDLLTLTFKLRPNVKWHPVEPVNGREFTADDVLYTWKRFTEIAQFRFSIVNSVNPAAPVLSVEVPDAQTMVMKLAQPLPALPGVLSYPVGGGLYFVPTEAEDKIDLRRAIAGTGHFYLEEYEPSVKFVLKRFEEYFEEGRPYLDGIDLPIVSEYAARLAQFRTGATLEGDFQRNIAPQDLLPLKSEVEGLDLYQGDWPGGFVWMIYAFSPDHKTPLRDIRVRQALSMAWDRDAWIEAVNELDKLRDAGLPVETRWHTALAAGFYEGWWLDPQDEAAFGPNAKYYHRNIEEAKKLLAAAGFPDGIDLVSNHISGPEFGATFQDNIHVMEGTAEEAGFRFPENAITYAAWQEMYDSDGEFDGYGYGGSPLGLQPDAVTRLFEEFHTKGSVFFGFDVDGVGNKQGDPFLDSEIEKARQEPDLEAQKARVKDLQRYLAEQQFMGRQPGVTRPFNLWWRAVKNVQTFQGGQRVHVDTWLDENEPPLKA
jgi:peptide/nickel transport system substrate-binding protein